MDSHDQWIAEQVLPLEVALTAYLWRVWPHAADVELAAGSLWARL